MTRRLRADGHEVVGVDLADADVVADLSTAAGRAAAVDGVIDAAGGALAGFVACAGVGPESRPSDLVVGSTTSVRWPRWRSRLPFIDREGRAVAFCSNSVGLAAIDDHTSHRRDARRRRGRGVRRPAGPARPGDLRHDQARPRDLDPDAGHGVGPARCPAQRRGARARSRRRCSRPAANDPVFGEFVDALPIPLGRTGQPDEIAGVVAFLLGPDASYVHGSIVFCDAGIDADARPHHV